LLCADAGTARVLGHDVARDGDAVRRRVSLTGQYAFVDEDLTGREHLILLAWLLGHRRAAARRRADELHEIFGLTDAASQVKGYSAGMRRRLDIAASIVVTTDLLFLDEPTTGLDPRSSTHVWEIIRALVAGGTTIVLTTQHLDEADALADDAERVADALGELARSGIAVASFSIGQSSLDEVFLTPTAHPSTDEAPAA
jgi:ABC-2 type transport system ATP-binding protein